MALSVQYAVFYLVFHIKNISPLSNQKQAVCSFLEHFQSYKIGLIFFIYFFLDVYTKNFHPTATWLHCPRRGMPENGKER